MTKDVLPTPCMMVDLDMFKANVKHMADTAKTNGINVRPHVKVHKSVDVARHQVAHGAIGLTVATIAEAELFSGAGIKGVLWTKQPVGVNNIQRAVALSKKDPTFMFVADDAQVVDWVEEAAAAHKTKVTDRGVGVRGHGAAGDRGRTAGAGTGAKGVFVEAHEV